MNRFMVKKLVQKDWYVIRYPVIGCAILAFVGLVLGLHGNGIAIVMSGVFLMISLILLMPAIVFTCIVIERKEQNLVFIMSLPVSNVEYTAAKVVLSLGLYFLFWLFVYAGTVSVLYIRLDISNSILPYLTLLFGEILMFYCLLFATAIVSQAESWTTAVMIFGNIVMSCTPGLAPANAGIRASLEASAPLWNGTILGVISFEVLVIIITISVMLYMQLKKKDFL